MASTVETRAAEVFFSIFFVTVVRSFAPEGWFKDMAIASWEAAWLSARLGFVAGLFAANLPTGAGAIAAGLRPVVFRSVAALVAAVVLVGRVACRTIAADLADFARTSTLPARALLGAAPACFGAADLPADAVARRAVLRALLIGPAALLGVDARAARPFDAGVDNCPRGFFPAPSWVGLVRVFPAAADLAGDFLPVALFEFALLAPRLRASAVDGAEAAFFDFGWTVSSDVFALGFRALGCSS